MMNPSAKCPKCGQMITYVNDFANGTAKFECNFDGGNGLDYNFDEMSHFDSDDYCCPVCGETLFNKEEDVVAFFKANLSSV